MSVATVQRFVQNQRNLFTQNERFSLSELHDMRYLGGQTSLFAAPGVHEHPDVLEIAVSIIEFERTLRECTSTDIEMIDMYLLALLFRFVNEMLNLMPLEEQTAAFQRLYETLTEFSECCRSQAAELKRLKYDVFCLDNAVSRCSLLMQVHDVCEDMPKIVLPVFDGATQVTQREMSPVRSVDHKNCTLLYVCNMLRVPVCTQSDKKATVRMLILAWSTSSPEDQHSDQPVLYSQRRALSRGSRACHAFFLRQPAASLVADWLPVDSDS
ncbi:MAG: hypothetical protein MHM6MM_003870 [Cercozoa sp. M6MM]